MKKETTNLSAATDIAGLRVPLKPLSDALIEAVRRFQLPDDTKVELMHCPMALDGGANWLQADAELRNPYYGERMLTCGDHVETLSATENKAQGETHVH